MSALLSCLGHLTKSGLVDPGVVSLGTDLSIAVAWQRNNDGGGGGEGGWVVGFLAQKDERWDYGMGKIEM